MSQFQRDTILADLRTSVMEIYFTKVNGQDRVMRCTLMPTHLPARYNNGEINEEKNFHNTNPDLIAAWSMTDNGWRSFHVQNVQYMQDCTANY